MNNHCIYMCRICLNPTLYTYCWLRSTCVDQFLHGTPFFRYHVCLMKFEFLSTTANQGTTIQIENLFIVNKTDKFNVSAFRNTQTHCQRPSQRGERSNPSRVQILVFWTLKSRMYRTPLKGFGQSNSLDETLLRVSLPKNSW